MYICENCGKLREELSSYDYFDNVDGNPSMSGRAHEEDTYCNSCWGHFVEAVECKICGEWTDANKGNICENCLKEHTNITTAIAYADKTMDKNEVKINSFIADLFDENQIDYILKNAIVEMVNSGNYNKEFFDKKVKDFCYNDKSHFIDYLETI